MLHPSINVELFSWAKTVQQDLVSLCRYLKVEGNLGQKGGLVHAYSSCGFSVILTSHGHPSRVVFPRPPPPQKKKQGLKNSRSTRFSIKLTRILIGSRLVCTQCEPLFFSSIDVRNCPAIRWSGVHDFCSQCRGRWTSLHGRTQTRWANMTHAFYSTFSLSTFWYTNPGLQSQCEVKQNKKKPKNPCNPRLIT